MKNIILIYRENDLFNTLIPFVASFLSTLGYEVDTIEFDRSTDKPTIKAALSDKLEDIKGRRILTDGTCKPGDDGPTAWDNAYGDFESVSSLDGLFGPTLVEAIAGVGSQGSNFRINHNKDLSRHDDYDVVLDYFRDIFLRVLKHIPEEQHPQTIYIAQSRISDHSFFAGLVRIDEVMSSTEAAELLGSWLSDAVLSADIRVLEAGSGRALMRQANEVDGDDVWLVADRHNAHHGFNPAELQATVLELPLSNFLQSAMRAGLLEVNQEEVEGGIREAVREEFGEE